MTRKSEKIPLPDVNFDKMGRDLIEKLRNDGLHNPESQAFFQEWTKNTRGDRRINWERSREHRRPLSPYATELFRKLITVVNAPTTIKLVKVSLRQLGFEKPVALEEIFTHATQKYPLTLLPSETGA
jgi:hypothetical protein